MHEHNNCCNFSCSEICVMKSDSWWSWQIVPLNGNFYWLENHYNRIMTLFIFHLNSPIVIFCCWAVSNCFMQSFCQHQKWYWQQRLGFTSFSMTTTIPRGHSKRRPILNFLVFFFDIFHGDSGKYPKINIEKKLRIHTAKMCKPGGSLNS